MCMQEDSQQVYYMSLDHPTIEWPAFQPLVPLVPNAGTKGLMVHVPESGKVFIVKKSPNEVYEWTGAGWLTATIYTFTMIMPGHVSGNTRQHAIIPFELVEEDCYKFWF